MLSQLITKSLSTFAQANKPRSVRQRLKFYGRFPDKFVLRTRIRPPNLKDQNIIFPIKIPIRYRHHFQLKRQLFVNTTEKIHWNRLQPNQILLGFEHVEYLQFKELVEGLRYLSQIKGQEKHDWNKHEWVSKAFNKVKQNIDRIKKPDIMNFYFLLKKLNYKDGQFWKKFYAIIEENIYDFYPRQLQHIYLTYYDIADQNFSPQAKKKFDKLMQGRLRQFSTEGIIQIFQKYLSDNRLDNYWLQNVFISLFKHQQYIYSAQQIARILRAMMILEHQNNDRLYQNLYNRIQKNQYKNIEELNLLKQVLLQVKEIFTSHRVDPILQTLQRKKQQFKQLNKQQKKKTIQQLVKDDLKYFLEKKKLKQETKGIEATQ